MMNFEVLFGAVLFLVSSTLLIYVKFFRGVDKTKDIDNILEEEDFDVRNILLGAERDIKPSSESSIEVKERQQTGKEKIKEASKQKCNSSKRGYIAFKSSTGDQIFFETEEELREYWRRKENDASNREKSGSGLDLDIDEQNFYNEVYSKVRGREKMPQHL